MPPRTIDTAGMRLSQMADQHEESNNPVYYAWHARGIEGGLNHESARQYAASSISRFGNVPPPLLPRAARGQDEDVAPPRKSPPTIPGGDEDAPRDSIKVAAPTVSMSAPSTEPQGQIRLGPPSGPPPLDPRRLHQAAGQRMSSAPSMSQEDAASMRMGSLPASQPPAPAAQLVESMVNNGMSREAAIAAVREKYGVDAAPPPQAPAQAPPPAAPPPRPAAVDMSTSPSASSRDDMVRGVIEETRRPGLSREARAEAIARAMVQNEKNRFIAAGYSEADAASMVNMPAISVAANKQLASDETQGGLENARARDVEDRRRAVTATGPQAAQMASEDAVTKRILSQNQNARTQGLGGQNRLWDENDPETRAMVARQIASEEKASNERAIADTGQGTRRVPTPRGAGGEQSKPGSSFTSADDAANYTQRQPDAPTLGEDGLPVGGKPGLYQPSQKDRDMAARGMVPVYGSNGEISYAPASFSGAENAPPGAPGRPGHRADLERSGYVPTEKLGPTGKQLVYAPGDNLRENLAAKKQSDLITRLADRAGLSPQELSALRHENDQNLGEDKDLIDRLRETGTLNKGADRRARMEAVKSQAMFNGQNQGKNNVNLLQSMPADWRNTVVASRLGNGLNGSTPNDVAAAAAGKDTSKHDEIIARLGMFDTQQKNDVASRADADKLRRDDLAQQQRQHDAQQSAAKDERDAAANRHALEMKAREADAKAAENRHSTAMAQAAEDANARSQQAQRQHELAIKQLEATVNDNRDRMRPAQTEAEIKSDQAKQAADHMRIEQQASSSGFSRDTVRALQTGNYNSPSVRADLIARLGTDDDTWWGENGDGYSTEDESRFKGRLQAAGIIDPDAQDALWTHARQIRYDESYTRMNSPPRR